MKSNDSNLDKQVLNLAVIVPNSLVQHNIALLIADHVTLLVKEAFPDSKIAKKYASRWTKTAAVISKSFAPHWLDDIIKHCISHPYVVGTDGSHDADTEKMNAIICLNIFDANRSKNLLLIVPLQKLYLLQLMRYLATIKFPRKTV